MTHKFFFVAAMLLNGLVSQGCQKKEAKVSLRCIYDQNVFAEAAVAASKDDVHFATFKTHPFLNLLFENLSKEEGEMWLQQIEEKYPSLKEKWAQFAKSDQVGSPRVFSFGEAGEFSPSTLRNIATAGQLQSKVGSWSGMHVVQIGAGYGGLCKIVQDVSGCASYTIVDLPEQLALAKKYLGAFGLNQVIYLTPEQLPKGASYDLALSDMHFSEFSCAYQELFIERIFNRAKAGFVLGRIFPKHYGVSALTLDEIKGRLGKLAACEINEPTIENENYFIYFERS